MIKAELYRNKKVAVFGLGKSGMATINSVIAGGGTVYAGDDKNTSLESAKKAGALTPPITNFPWKEITSLILSPGVPLTHPKPHPVVELAREHNVEIIGDVEVLHRHNPDAKYIGITGTNGKSTTTALTYHIFREAGLNVQVGGNLGTAALTLEPLGDDGHYVLEMSSYQLDLINDCRFNVAMLLNITPDHIDRHGTMLGYITAKKRIFDKQQDDDFAVVSLDDQFSAGIYEFLTKFENRANVIPVTLQGQIGGGVFANEGSVFVSLDPNHISEFDISSVQSLRGSHNWQNACFAIAAAMASGISMDVIFKALVSFPGLAHRMEKVGEVEGVTFINDSKATNADAASRALVCYKNIFWIAGGKAKEGGIESLSPFYNRINKAFLIGEAQDKFATTLEGKVDCEKCDTLEVAFERAADEAYLSGLKDAVVLLSPACASFDQWPNFEARGDAFRELTTRFIKRLNTTTKK